MLNIGVVGTGIFATQKHLPAITKTEGLRIAGCHNRSRAKADQFAQDAKAAQDAAGAASGSEVPVKVYDSMEALVADPAIDAVDALLPAELNYAAVDMAVRAGKPICFEKPIAASLRHAAKIVELAESTDVPVMVLENWSFHTATEKLKVLLPRIGAPVLFNYEVSGTFKLTPYHGTAWRQNPKHAGGFISDGGVHDVALITDVLGPVRRAAANVTQWHVESGTVDTMQALFTLDTGASGTFTQARFCAETPFMLRFQVWGRDGTLVFEKSDANPTGEVALHRPGAAAETFVLADNDLNGVTAEFANWRDVLVHNDKSRVRVTPRRAFHHYAVIYAAVEAATTGGCVDVEKLD